MQMMAFAIACEGASIEAMKAAVRAYLTGTVRRENNAFAPSAAEFAEQVRYQQLVIDAANRPRLPKPQEQQFSEEHRERMLGKISILAKAQRGDQQAVQELQKLVKFRVEFKPPTPLEAGE